MFRIRMADVGHGLTVGFELSNNKFQIDCGASEKYLAKAFYKGLCFINPEIFFLSHFHSDHYKGLIYGENALHPSLNIKEVYFPRIPDFDKREELLKSLLAMNLFVLGDETGSMELDFLNVISRLNSCRYKYKTLSRGNTINIGQNKIEIL